MVRTSTNYPVSELLYAHPYPRHLTTATDQLLIHLPTAIMSWNAYTDSLISTGKIDKAAICSSAGDSLWAKSEAFTISPQEIILVANGYSDPSQLQAHGLHVEGKKYFLLKADDRSIYGKQDDHGIVAVKTKQAILIAHYPSGVQAPEATLVVEKLADYLISLGY